MANIESRTLRPLFDDSWKFEPLARDTETTAKALRKSISDHRYSYPYSTAISPLPFPPPEIPMSSIPVNGGGKPTKPRRRASTRIAATTFIAANPAEFRQVVQQLTGVKSDPISLPFVASNSKKNKDHNNAVKVYTRRDSMEIEQQATLAELGTDPENEGVISDLLRFARDKEFCKTIGKAWKRGYLFNDSPGTDRSSLIAAMANRLEFDVHDLDLTGLSSISELTDVLVSIRNRSLIAIKDFDHWVENLEMLPNLKSELTLSGLLKIIHVLLWSCGDERIIVLTTNHNHSDRVDATLLHLLSIDLYIHTSSPQPIALADGREIVQLDSSEQKPLVDYDATTNRVLVSYSEEKNTREGSRRQCMTKSVLHLVDSTTRISSLDFDDAVNSAHLMRAYQSGPIVFNSEKKDTGEGLIRACLTKTILSLDDSSKKNSLPDVDATENKAHLVRADQSGHAASLSENKNGGEALKRECITEKKLGLEDLQQNSGGRRGDAAKSFGAIYDPGIPTTDSLSQKSFEVLETLPTQEELNDCVPLLSVGRLTLEGCTQEEKSPDLPTIMQLFRYLGGLTAQSASSSRWPIGLPDGRHVLLLDPVEQSTKNVAHAAKADQCSPTMSLPEKKMARKTLKRECRTMSVIFEIHQQHFGRRCEGIANSFGATGICRKHGINQVSTMKRIHKQHEIHQRPFHQKWAIRKGYSVVDEGPFEVSSDEKLDSMLQFIHMSQFARSSPRPLALPDGGEIVGPTALSSSEFAVANNRAHLVGQDQTGSIASHYERKNTRETSDKQGLTMILRSVEDLEQHFGCKHKVAVKSFGGSLSMFKSTCRQHWVYWWRWQFENNDSLAWKSFEVLDSLPLGEQSNSIRHLARQRTLTHKHCVQLKKSPDLPRSLQRDCSGGLAAQSDIGLPDGGHIPSLSEKKIVRKTLKRKCRTMSVLSLEVHQQHVGRRWEDDVKFLGAKRICRQLAIHRESTVKRIRRQHGTRRWPFKQSAINLPDGGLILYHSKKKIVRKTLKRKCRTMSVLGLDYQQHVNIRWEDAVKSLGAKRIRRQLVIHRVSTTKRIRRQLGIHQWLFQRNWASMKGHSLGDERPFEVMSLSADGKLVSRLQRFHISWLGRFAPQPSALPGGGEIVGPIALSSTEFASTNNKAQHFGQDKGGSAASDSKKKRREQEDCEEINTSITLEDLRQHYGRKRKDVAESLGVSVSTLKRTCRQYGIKRWPNIIRKKAGRPPDQHGEKNPSPTCKTLSTNGQTQMENEIVGHLEETDEFLLDFVEGPNGVSSECEFQLKNQWSWFSTYPNSDGPVVPHPHIASTQILGENMESLGDWRNLFASLEEPLLQGHVSESMWTVPPCLDPAPSQPMPTIAHATGSSDDLRYLLPLVGEPFLTGHVSGSIDWTVPPCSVPAPSQPMPIAHTTGSSDDLRNLLPLVGEPFSTGHVSGYIDWTVPPCFVPAPSQSMPTIAHTTGSSADLRNLLALMEEPFSAGQVSGSVSWTVPSCFDPALSQLMPTIPHTMPTIPCMVPLLMERQDTRSVKVRATYEDTTIKFNLPLTSGISELNKEVLRRLEFELGKFRVEYEDEDGILILIACDEDVRDYLQFLTSSGNQVFKPLVLKKVPNTTNVCATCESLKRRNNRYVYL